jgi:hypothetical protein
MILPEILLLENSISDYSDLGLDSEKFSNTKPGDDPSEIFAVREYKDGDKPSKIHWKLTAKANELMVKDYSLPLADSFLILTDTYIPNSDRKAEIYDTEIQLVASVSNLFLENQARHKIAAYNEKEQAFFEQTVSDEESFISACSELLSCGSCNSPSLAAKALLSDDENTARYGHMIFVTANFDRRIVDMLVSSGTAFRYTIMLCTDGEDLSKTAELDSNAQIIPIRSGRIEQSLAEIVF